MRHVGCPIVNPLGWLNWPSCGVALILFWALLPFFPWNLVAGGGVLALGWGSIIAWELRHAPSKMYRTWWPS
jgi:hypothetical protein